MSTETTTEVTTPTSAPAASKPTKKVVKKAAAKKATKKVAKKGTKTAKKAERAPRAKKEGLRGPQVRILQTLVKKPGLTRAQIAEKAEVDNAFCTTWIGSLDADARAENEKKRGIMSLLGLKYVRAEKHDVDGKDVVQYFVTASGKAALEKSLKAA